MAAGWVSRGNCVMRSGLQAIGLKVSDHLHTLREERLVQDGTAELWATFNPVSRRRHGCGASLGVELQNTGGQPLQILGLDFAWRDGQPHRLELTRLDVLAPGSTWAVLNPRSYAEVLELAKQAGKNGFGVDSTLHEVTVRLVAPVPTRLRFQVIWGFATLEHDLGFFLPALEH